MWSWGETLPVGAKGAFARIREEVTKPLDSARTIGSLLVDAIIFAVLLGIDYVWRSYSEMQGGEDNFPSLTACRPS